MNFLRTLATVFATASVLVALFFHKQKLAIPLAVLALLCLLMGKAFARDLGQWTNTDPEVSAWYRGLMRPDPGYTNTSCCGDADAYWCDDVSVKDGHVFCAITDTRDDVALNRPHRPVGEVHEIPPEKTKFGPTDPQHDHASNPTGHTIIFLSSASGDNAYVYCFVPDTGI